jgi:hypothetical protein
MHRAVANDEHRKVLSAIGHLRRLGAWLATGPRIAAIAIATLLKQDICTTQAAATRVQISPGKTIPPGELATVLALSLPTLQLRGDSAS